MTTPSKPPHGQRPYWANDDDTQMIPSSTPSSVQPVPSDRGVQGASPRAEKQGPTLLAGRYDAKRTTVNLAVLAALAAVITGAALWAVNTILAATTSATVPVASDIVVKAILTALIGIAVGLIYIPVVTTGNESLFGAAIDTLAVAAAVSWVLFGGLLNGDWSTLSALALIICTAIAAHAAPSRIESARVR